MSKLTFEKAFDQYYKLKNEYDNSNKKIVNKILDSKDPNKSTNIERFEYQKKCINCKKLGGTIFKQTGNMLVAYCNAKPPCKLDIQLQRAYNENIRDQINAKNDEILDLKKKTINTKLNYLFGFNTKEETVSVFEKLKEQLILITKVYQKLNEQYESITDNNKVKEQLKLLDDELFKYINDFREFIKNYEDEGEINYIKSALEIYINNIEPIITNIQNTEYNSNYLDFQIEKNNITITYLIQDRYSLEQLITTIPGTENKIIKFSK